MLHLLRWWGCKAPKTLYFQCCCHPLTPYFCWLSLLSPKDPPFFGEMWALQSLLLKDPLFLHSTATGSYFLFQFHGPIDHFCHFQRFFFSSNSCFESAHWKIKSKHTHPMPLILNQNWASHPVTPHFLRLCSHQMPQPLEVWALHLYPFELVCPPPRAKKCW